MCGDAGPRDREDYYGGRDNPRTPERDAALAAASVPKTIYVSPKNKAASLKLFDGDTGATILSDEAPVSIGNALGMDEPTKRQKKKRTSVPGLSL